MMNTATSSWNVTFHTRRIKSLFFQRTLRLTSRYSRESVPVCPTPFTYAMTNPHNAPSQEVDTSGSTQSQKLQITQLKLSSEADGRLRRLYGRTGITPNLLCRLGFCLSVNESGDPKSDTSAEVERVIKQPVLLGGYDPLFISLLKLRHPHGVRDSQQCEQLFSDHVHRGIMLLANRVRSPSDVLALVPANPQVGQ